jgi:Holliday junction DNA helicase RuvA
MIASIRGELLEIGDGFVIVEAGGVGYHVHVSTQTLAALPSVGAEVFLRTRHIVREDAQLLFGFDEAVELRLFDLLIGVSGVGPKMALAALSGLRPALLARAIRDEAIATLIAVPGIGRKTAERLIIELRDKLDFIPLGASGPPAPSAGKGGSAASTGGRSAGVLPKNEMVEDAVAALVTLGLPPAQAQEAVKRAGEGQGDLSLEELVKRALSRLGKAAVVSR